jgi:hypothetical protein
MVAHVFISYSHGDREYVERLKKHLVDAGLSVWTDTGIDYGSRWSATIGTQIDGCAAFVPVMSEHSRGSEWVRKEILYAQENNKPILPLLLNGKRFIELIHVQDDPVTDGRLPSIRFIDGLRALAGDDVRDSSQPSGPPQPAGSSQPTPSSQPAPVPADSPQPAFTFDPSEPSGRRSRGPLSAVREAIKRSRATDAYVRETLFNQWSDLVGRLFTGVESRPVKLEAGELTVEVDSPGDAKIMQVYAPRVMARISQKVGEGVVTKLIVYLKEPDPSDR